MGILHPAGIEGCKFVHFLERRQFRSMHQGTLKMFFQLLGISEMGSSIYIHSFHHEINYIVVKNQKSFAIQ